MDHKHLIKAVRTGLEAAGHILTKDEVRFIRHLLMFAGFFPALGGVSAPVFAGNHLQHAT